MISIVSGLIVSCAAGSGLWYFMPHGGRSHPLTQRPLLDSLIPITIVTAFAVGGALLISGIISFT